MRWTLDKVKRTVQVQRTFSFSFLWVVWGFKVILLLSYVSEKLGLAIFVTVYEECHFLI